MNTQISDMECVEKVEEYNTKLVVTTNDFDSLFSLTDELKDEGETYGIRTKNKYSNKYVIKNNPDGIRDYIVYYGTALDIDKDALIELLSYEYESSNEDDELRAICHVFNADPDVCIKEFMRISDVCFEEFMENYINSERYDIPSR